MPHELRAVGVEYAAIRESLSVLVRSLGPHELAAPVPSCPGWSVHDVIAHLAGVAADAVNGVHPSGSLDEWTARHVEERRGTATNLVLREWERSSSQFEVLLNRDGSTLPASVIDAATHDDDIRGAVGRPGASTPVHEALPMLLAQRWMDGIERAGVAPVRVVLANGDLWAGDVGAELLVRATPSFLYRAAMGRRRRDQIEECFVEGPPSAAHIDLLCVFGPSEDALTH